MRKIAGFTAAGLLAVAAVVALTGFRGGCGGHRHGQRDPAAFAAHVTNRVDGLLDDVDATPEQRARIHAVKDRMLAAGTSARAGHREVHEALRAEWTSPAPDQARLHALVDARVEEMRALLHEAVRRTAGRSRPRARPVRAPRSGCGCPEGPGGPRGLRGTRAGTRARS
jgi:periplasmic protein CpxP/Spy